MPRYSNLASIYNTSHMWGHDDVFLFWLYYISYTIQAFDCTHKLLVVFFQLWKIAKWKTSPINGQRIYIYIYDWYYINIYIYVCWCFWLAMSERIGSSTRPSGCCHPAESLPCGPLEVQDDAVPGNVCAEVQFLYPSEPGNIGPLPMCIPWISKLSQRIRIQQAYMPEFCLWF